MEEDLLLLCTEDLDDVEDGLDFNVALGELFDLFKQFWSLLRVEVGEEPLPLVMLAKVEVGEVLLPLLRLARVEGNISSLSSSSNEEGRQDSNSSGAKASLLFW